MKIVCLKFLFHRNEECIGIYFAKDPALQKILQSAVSARWSKTHICWYVPLNEENYRKISASLSGKVKLDVSALREHLEKRTQTITEKQPDSMPQSAVTDVAPPPNAHRYGKENIDALEKFRQMLTLKAYSASTIRTYTNEFRAFLGMLKNVPADTLTVDRIKDYLQYCSDHMKLSENTLHSRINALKFYYEQVLGREKFFHPLPRPKKRKPLPKTFNQDEIAAIINSIDNKKHKAMVMLSYSAGLRVSEVVSLRTHQIDAQRMTLFISNAKGKKDRVVALSPVLLIMLRQYAAEYRPKKEGYLFEGNLPGTAYSVRSLQLVLAAAKKKAGVVKPGSIHTLRHSFATHLIDKGTDITMIQKLLGHSDIRTTLLYLHTSNKDLLKIISPLDDLNLD